MTMVPKNDSEATVLRKSRVAREHAHVRLRAGERTDVTKRRKVDERVFSVPSVTLAQQFIYENRMQRVAFNFSLQTLKNECSGVCIITIYTVVFWGSGVYN